MRPGRRLGVDVGDVRIGVALCDPDGLIATELETIAAGPDAIDRLATLITEHQVIECVIGLPLSLSGRQGPAARKVRDFAKQLIAKSDTVPVCLVDERMSTVEATNQLRHSGVSGRKQRTVVDQAAARVILQSALDAERISGTRPGRGV